MPRQITSFEFKLIGFLTLKQFIYLIVFVPLGFIVFKLFPLPILNIVLAVLVGGIGPAFAFLPVNERPLDVWIKNMYKRLTSATQYMYIKQNAPVYFLQNLFFTNDPHRVATHIESQEKLAAYLSKTKKDTSSHEKKQTIATLLQNPSANIIDTKSTPQTQTVQVAPSVGNNSTAPAPSISQPPPIAILKKAFFSGVVKNHKLIPLPGILIYVRNGSGEMLRLLKTNPHGVFATFKSLPESTYQFEMKDPKGTYFFDTMNIKIEAVNPKPLEFFSKELL